MRKVVFTGERASGKTVELVKLASVTRFTILTANPYSARYFQSICEMLHLRNVNVHVVRDIEGYMEFLESNKPYYIDEFENFIMTVFNCEPTLLQGITTLFDNYPCNGSIYDFVKGRGFHEIL